MATLDADKPSTTESDAPLDIDLYCLNCGYNLRGLPGDPIRCPECFHLNPLPDLLGTAQLATHHRLATAVDACTVGMFLLLLVALTSLSAATILYCGAPLLVVAGAIVLFGAREIRKLTGPAGGWQGAIARYLLWTFTFLGAGPTIWVACVAFVWASAMPFRDTASLDLAHYLLGSVLAVAILVHWHPVSACRRRQRAAFESLSRQARAIPVRGSPRNLRDAVSAASLKRGMQHDSLVNILRSRFAAAVAKVAGVKAGQIDPQVRPAQEARFGDYQCNVAMSLAKQLKAKPREIAGRIIAELDVADLCEPPEIAGPGFINVRLTDDALSRHLGEIPAPPAESESGARATGTVGEQPEAPRSRSGFGLDRLGMPPVEKPRRVVIDYSSPNIAKQMHVGHLRSTIIGDVFARVLGFEGHAVIRQNHVGDWGTQFGILIELYKHKPIPTPRTHDDVLQAIEDDYRAAQERFESDAAFADAARQSVGALQSGDPEARRVWERICAQSRHAFTDAYRRLNVLLQDEDVRGESFYRDRLASVVVELREKLPGREKNAQPAPWAELREDQGAQCVYFYDAQGAPRFKKPDGDELPMIIQKSDGAYLYATTDLAALRYRIQELGATRLIYVTDARQKLHFQMLFAAARAIGWAGDDVQLEHATFGSVLGANRRPLKTREGENVKLRELLNEAERRAYELLESRESDEATKRRSDEGEVESASRFSEVQKREVARRVGIGAVKYADLARDRNSDYVFNWDQMLALQGNTAPYMMYAYARIRSIYRKAAERFGSPDVYGAGVTLALGEPAERALALRLARLRETIDAVAAELAPHILCSYLYELAAEFMRFYEACPVIQAPDEATRLSRIRLCDLTARALKLGLGLLGIEAVERM